MSPRPETDSNSGGVGFWLWDDMTEKTLPLGLAFEFSDHGRANLQSAKKGTCDWRAWFSSQRVRCQNQQQIESDDWAGGEEENVSISVSKKCDKEPVLPVLASSDHGVIPLFRDESARRDDHDGLWSGGR